MLSREEFLEMAKNKLKKWNSNIDILEHRTQHYKETRKADYERILINIRQKQNDAINKINGIKSEGEEHWHSLKDQAEQSLTTLDESIKHFKSNIK